MGKIKWKECWNPEYPNTDFWGLDGWADGFDYHIEAGDDSTSKRKIQREHDAFMAEIFKRHRLMKVADLDKRARANGYVKLAHDEIVMPRKLLERMIREQCVSCHFDETELPNCGDCDIKPIRDRIKEARDE
jgi:hypothetical protein